MGEEKFGYVWYDFNHEVKKIHYDNLQSVVPVIQDFLNSMGYFSAYLLSDGLDK
jgi:hypothetical protein